MKKITYTGRPAIKNAGNKNTTKDPADTLSLNLFSFESDLKNASISLFDMEFTSFSPFPEDFFFDGIFSFLCLLVESEIVLANCWVREQKNEKCVEFAFVDVKSRGKYTVFSIFMMYCEAVRCEVVLF